MITLEDVLAVQTFTNLHKFGHVSKSKVSRIFQTNLHSGNTNIAIEYGPFQDVFPIKHPDIPLPFFCLPEGTQTTNTT